MKKYINLIASGVIFGLLCLWTDVLLSLAVSVAVYFGLRSAQKTS